MFGWCDEDGGSKIFWFKETGEVIPVAIESVGCGQGVLGEYRFSPGGSIEDSE